MRVLRTILGLLLLIIGLPALLAGAAFWAAMQHRDAGGAFSGDLQHTVTPGYAVVVPDADSLLRRDAPFARAGDTRLRLTAYTSGGPAFIGIAPAAKVARYLDDVPQDVVTTVDLGTGALPVATDRVTGASAPASVPDSQSFWLKSATGGLDWHPSALRGRHYSLVIMSPSAQPGFEVAATAELSPGWLNSATWSLLILGSLLVMAGIVVLAWPGCRREVVYVVEPSQVPDLMVAIGAPLPLSRTGGGRHAGTHRPRTLADAGAKPTQRALPPLAWPPSPGTATAPVSPAISASPSRVPGASPAGGPSAVPPSPAEYAAATAIPGTARGIGQRTPAPGKPLSLIGGVPSKGVPSSSPAALPFPAASSSPPSAPPFAAPSSSAPSSSASSSASASAASASSSSAAPAAAANEAPADRSAERIGRRRAGVQPSDTPVFEATAVGAWVAETAAARARETQARAAAVLAAEAARRQAAEPAKGGTADAAKSAAAEGAKRETAEVEPQVAEVAKPQAAEDAKREGVEAAKTEAPVGRPAVGAHAATDETPEPEMAPAAALGRNGDSAMPIARPAGPAVSGSGPEGWSATGLRRADSPRLSATVTGGQDLSRTDAAAKAATDAGPKVPNKGDETPPIAAKIAPGRNEPNRSVAERSVSKSPLEPAAPARPSGPESTAPAPARPAPPNRPAVPAPARPAPPPRPNPEPTPSRPAAERPAVSQPAVSQPADKDGDGTPTTQPKDGRFQAPVHVSISDRPAVVSQPGSSIPGGASEPAADIVRRPATETPSTKSEIQARLQAAMKSPTRQPGEPRSSVPPGSPTAVPSSTIAAAPVRPVSSTDAVRIGVAGRRDYPASARRDNDAARSGRTGAPAAKPASSASKPMAGEDTSATTAGNHIAEQRVDSDQSSPYPTAAEAGGKARRAAARATKPDRTKSAKPETEAPSVPGARISAYAEEAAELLAGLSPDRRRRKQDGAANQATEPPSARKEPAKD
jgi:hypothetical protein